MTHDDLDARRQEDAQIRSMLAREWGRTRIALAMGWTDNKARHRIDAIREADGAQTAPVGAEPPPPVAATDEVTRTESQDGITLTVERGERITTLEALLAATDVDLAVWHVEKYTVNSWEVAAKDADGAMVPTTVYQVKAHLKRIPGADLLAGLRDAVLADIREQAAEIPRVRPVRVQATADPARRHLCVFSLFDVHFGKLAWREETGADFDLRIARDRFDAAVDDLLAESSGWPIARYVLPIGQDMLQVDSDAGTTTAGTHVDTDSRYTKAFRIARRCASDAIRRLAAIAPVQVPVVPGNHDRNSAFHLGEVLDAEFAGNAAVTFDNSPRRRKYVRWGVNLIGLTHGDQMKLSELPLTMAQEQREAWGETRCRVWMTGHRHKKAEVRHTAGDSFKGVRVLTLPALCSADAWHVDSGYIGETPSGEAHIFSFTRGYRSHIESPVLDTEEVAADAARAA